MVKNKQLPHHFKYKTPVIVVIGPTAAGKTDFSFSLAEKLSAEIINADVGQFYKPFSVGVAKPDWQNAPVACHLFDIIDDPVTLNVVTFRTLVFKKIDEIIARGNVPMLVGGSHFYVKSLFYPPITNYDNTKSQGKIIDEQESLWNQLNSIDSVRAASLHPNDTYRLERALDLWQTTGQLPSSLEPVFVQEFPVLFVVVDPGRDLLRERIEQRAIQMINQDGWITEVQQLLGTKWEYFMKSKRLIGYDLIVDALLGKQATSYDDLIKLIQYETWDYAKRQQKFIRRFLEHLKKAEPLHKGYVEVLTISGNLHESLDQAISSFNNLIS